jgi:cellulose synthase/poly-beta-1,6-N-acetylglucosamine synthase-like glycosyltransferase
VAESKERAAELESENVARVRKAEIADATVIILAYTEERWSLTCDAVESACNQSLLPREIIVCVEGNPELAERFRDRWQHRPESLPSIRVVDNQDGEPGLDAAEQERVPYASHGIPISAERTRGVMLASTEIVVFLDDDASADPDWLERLLAPFADPSVLAVTGAPLPVYGKPRPRWFPFEFDWIFGCAYRGLPTQTAPLLRLIGANMAIRRESVLAVGGFHSLADDLDMSHRLLQLSPQGLIYEPRAVVHHYVHAERLTWHYFWRRCWTNRDKVEIMRGLGEAANLRADRRWALRSVSVGVATGLREFLGGDVGGLQRALAIITGLGIAGVGHLTAIIDWKVATWRRRESPSAV